MNIEARFAFATEITASAGTLARDYFGRRDALVVDQKGAQDWVSEADREVELFLRAKIAEAWPEDGVIGEEHAPTRPDADFCWVIDPIDGTTNFVNGIPNWTVVLAGICNQQTEIGVIHDPNVMETFATRRGLGATLNGETMRVDRDKPLDQGTVALGYSHRVDPRNMVPIIDALLARGAMFHRNASGALSLAYVASGRLLGYLEEYMNAWDCLAGQLLVEEAGGQVEPQNADDMIVNGGRVIAAAPKVFNELQELAHCAWTGQIQDIDLK